MDLVCWMETPQKRMCSANIGGIPFARAAQLSKEKKATATNLLDVAWGACVLSGRLLPGEERRLSRNLTEIRSGLFARWW